MSVSKFSNMVLDSLLSYGQGYGGFFGLIRSVPYIKKFEQWDPNKIIIGKNQLGRGLTMAQTINMLSSNRIGQCGDIEKFGGLENSDIGRQAARGGDPNLLSMSSLLYTCNLYGANKGVVPRSGTIIVANLPAVFTDISEQANICPEMCNKEQIIEDNRALISGRTANCVKTVTRECNEISAVVGKYDGVSFCGMYDVNTHVDKIYYVVGTGRPNYMGFVPITSCLVNTFENPNYAERVLAIKIVLTSDPKHLEVLNDKLELGSGERVLTPRDAAIIMGDPVLRELAKSITALETKVLSTLPRNVHGRAVVEYVKSLYQEDLSQLMDSSPLCQRRGDKNVVKLKNSSYAP